MAYSDGKSPLGGMVQFQSLENRRVSCTGELDDQGRFTLKTFVAGNQSQGAINGKHRVTIIPANDSGLLLAPQVLRDHALIRDGENKFEFKIQRKPG